MGNLALKKKKSGINIASPIVENNQIILSWKLCHVILHKLPGLFMSTVFLEKLNPVSHPSNNLIKKKKKIKGKARLVQSKFVILSLSLSLSLYIYIYIYISW
jgi:hypothetical protein